MRRVQKHFQKEAGSFDARVLKSVPFYRDMLEALVSSMPFRINQKIKVADLGCGTGSVSLKVKGHYPRAAITCVDFSSNMLEVAKNKLKDYQDIRYVESDVMDFDFSGYDAVLSSLTLHHIWKGAAKRALYKKIFRGLHNGGVFYVADLSTGATDYLCKLNLKKWEEFLLQSLTKEEIAERKKSHKEEDQPFKLMEEISWLKEAGFRHIEVIWKYYYFAVYGGQKGK
jgi:tRNA (cmo5U34)-methyltransferase